MHEEISTLEERLTRLKNAVEPVKRMLHRAEEPTTQAEPAPKKKRKKRMTPERKASMQMQGKYLGLLTRLPKNQRAKYKVIAKNKVIAKKESRSSHRSDGEGRDLMSRYEYSYQSERPGERDEHSPIEGGDCSGIAQHKSGRLRHWRRYAIA